MLPMVPFSKTARLQLLVEAQITPILGRQRHLKDEKVACRITLTRSLCNTQQVSLFTMLMILSACKRRETCLRSLKLFAKLAQSVLSAHCAFWTKHEAKIWWQKERTGWWTLFPNMVQVSTPKEVQTKNLPRHLAREAKAWMSVTCRNLTKQREGRSSKSAKRD